MTEATFIDTWGYVWVPAPAGHPKATKRARLKDGTYGNQQGYVKRCWLVVEQRMGRGLRKDESVHHINGQKDDDSPGNLQVLTHSEHARLHQAMRNPRRRIGAPSGKGPCVRCGQMSCCDLKRGLCNACYIKAKRLRQKTSEWPQWAELFPSVRELRSRGES